MKILFFSHYFPPEGNAPASRVFELCRRWVKDGHEVTVVTGVPNVPSGVVYEGYRNKLYQEEQRSGIRVIRLWTYLAANKGNVRRTLNYLSYMIAAVLAGLRVPRPDVVIATSPQFFCGWAGAVVSRFRSRPFILEIRDIWPESIEVVGALRGRPLLRVLEWLERRLYASAAHIVTVGEGYQRKLLERGVSRERVSIVMNGVDRELFRPEVSGGEVRREYGLKDKFVCSYIGTVGMACGLEVVLRAAHQFKTSGDKDVAFLIVGEGAVLEELRKKAGVQGLENIVFAGRQPKERIPEFLSASDACLVHLRKQELFSTVMPSKIFEALAMARPVILGVRGFAADFLQKAGGGICIEPENENQLLGAIRELQRDPDFARKAGESGRDYVLRHYDRDLLARSYLEVLKKVCACHAEVAPKRSAHPPPANSADPARVLKS